MVWFVPHLWTALREQSARCRFVPSDIVYLRSQENTENIKNYIFKGTILSANNNIEFVPFWTDCQILIIKIVILQYVLLVNLQSKLKQIVL